MRISSSMQQLLVKTESKQKGPSLSLGAIVKGQILAMDGKLATLLVDGKTLAVQLPETYRGSTGDVLEFEVNDIKDQTIIASLVKDQVQDSEVFYEKLGITKPQALDQEVVNLMKALKMPMDKQTFDSLKTAIKNLQMAEKLSPIEVQEGETLKEAVVRVLKNADLQVQKMDVQALENGSKNAPEVKVTDVDTSNNGTTNEGNVTSSTEKSEMENQLPSIKEDSSAESKKQVERTTVNLDKDQSIASAVKRETVNLDVERKHLALMIKEKLPVLLNKLIDIDQVMKGDKLLAKSVERLDRQESVLKSLNISTKDILVMIKGGDVKAIEVIKEEIVLAKAHADPATLVELESAEKDFSMIQEIVQVSRDLQQDIFYMDIPILFRDEVESLTLMAKKRKGKLDKDDIRLYLALDTINLDKVRTIIDYSKNRINIQFRLMSEEALSAFDGIKDDLRVSVEGFQDGKVVNVTTGMYEDTLPIEDIEPDDFEYHRVDMKV